MVKSKIIWLKECIQNIFGVLLYILVILCRVIAPIMALMLTLIVLYFLTFAMPYVAINRVPSLFGYPLSLDLVLFLSLICSFVGSVYLVKYLRKAVIWSLKYLMRDFEKIQVTRLEEFINIFYQKENVLFLIYLIYFGFILFLSIIKFQGISSILNNGTEEVILQSFLAFIAFANLNTKFSDVKLAPRKLFELYLKIILKK